MGVSSISHRNSSNTAKTTRKTRVSKMGANKRADATSKVMIASEGFSSAVGGADAGPKDAKIARGSSLPRKSPLNDCQVRGTSKLGEK